MTAAPSIVGQKINMSKVIEHITMRHDTWNESMEAHEGVFWTWIQEYLNKGYRLPNWGDRFIYISWNWDEIVPGSGIYKADAHCHLNKKGENTTDYVLHYPSGVLTKKECLPRYAKYSD